MGHVAGRLGADDPIAILQAYDALDRLAKVQQESRGAKQSNSMPRSLIPRTRAVALFRAASSRNSRSVLPRSTPGAAREAASGRARIGPEVGLDALELLLSAEHVVSLDLQSRQIDPPLQGRGL